VARGRRSRLRFVAEGVEGAAIMLGALSTWPVSKRWLDNWGARPADLGRAWPGDALVPPPQENHTRAIDIEAPAAEVWPWIAQFGMRKAGFYSYELLERVVGIPVENLEYIEPAMQSLDVGDEILLHPKAPGIPVGLLEPGSYVCFGKRDDADASTDTPRRSWSIYVEPMSASSCRLIVRSSIERVAGASVLARVAGRLEQPVDFVMEQRLLRTVKRLAEEAARNPLS